FRDIAIAMTFATAISLFVSISVIPMLSEKFFRLSGEKKKERFAVLGRFGGRLVEAMMGFVNLAMKNTVTRLTTVLSLTFFSVVVTALLLPKMEYLPQGNRNLVINLLVPPPGLSYEEKMDIGKQFFRSVEPHFNKEHNGLPGIKNMFYVGSEQIMLSGAISDHEQRAGELVPLFMQKINSIPGMFGVSSQAGIFQTRLGRARTIEVDVSGSDINQLIKVAGTMFGMINNEIRDAQIRPVPSLELLFPEARLLPDRDRLRASGLSAEDLGIAVDVLMDGRKIGDFKQEGQKKIDLIVKAGEEDIKTPEELYNAMISTPGGKVVPVSSVSALERTSGITEIRHLERNRTITLQVTPPFTMPIEEAMELIDNKIIPAVKSLGLLQGVNVRQSGVADKLTETRKALQWNLILAAVITYLLMAALYENFVYPFIIMLTVPLAGAGGFIGLKLVNILIGTQPLDVLTMLGFVILIGVVVNNAILIVHQTLHNIREYGMEHREAVLDATRSRLRPIYMAAFTSIFAMLPLVVAPGPGSELYRGLGSVIIGGLAVSTVFTVFVIPALLMFVIKMEKVQNKKGF
ncbi:MAG: efflux RND transporter permease subunit, partial [Nitrospiraceae bacterium]